MALILVVEDDAVNQELVSRFLRREGHRVLIAPDGPKAVDMAQANTPDLILMDLGLPEMDGWEVTRRIKAIPKTNQIPVIALTAHAHSDEVIKAKEVGCDGYETKPIAYARLMRKIRTLIGDV